MIVATARPAPPSLRQTPRGRWWERAGARAGTSRRWTRTLRRDPRARPTLAAVTRQGAAGGACGARGPPIRSAPRNVPPRQRAPLLPPPPRLRLRKRRSRRRSGIRPRRRRRAPPPPASAARSATRSRRRARLRPRRRARGRPLAKTQPRVRAAARRSKTLLAGPTRPFPARRPARAPRHPRSPGPRVRLDQKRERRRRRCRGRGRCGRGDAACNRGGASCV
mmetsp:Transcript_29814/g.89040  ORF Transcript_29814/g.89040 Transcript_29814/m.89040 type:complete len:222 (+) Transcript_29814:776-1441(+)